MFYEKEININTLLEIKNILLEDLKCIQNTFENQYINKQRKKLDFNLYYQKKSYFFLNNVTLENLVKYFDSIQIYESNFMYYNRILEIYKNPYMINYYNIILNR